LNLFVDHVVTFHSRSLQEHDFCHAPNCWRFNLRTEKQRFDMEVMDTIVRLLEPDDHETGDILWTAIDVLFSDHWKVKKWFDLQVFSAANVAVALTPMDTIPAEVTAPVIVKKLGVIEDYSRVGCLFESITMQEIVKDLHAHSLKPAFTPSTPTSPAR
jgi:hypothetical protein